MPNSPDATNTPSADNEIGRTVEQGSRKARVDLNRIYSEGPYGVFMHTRYAGRWYYDGYRHYADLPSAIAARNCWLDGGKI